MDSRAQNIINKMTSLTSQFGVNVAVNRVVQASTPTYDAFGEPTNSTNNTFTSNVIVESQKIDLTSTLLGGKQTEVMKLIANTGVFLLGDEISYSNHTFKVEFVEPVNFTGSNVVDFVHASREVD